MIALEFFADRDNYEDVALYAAEAVVSAESITRVVVELERATLDSESDPDLFDFPVELAYVDIHNQAQTTDGLRLKFGGAGLAAGTHTGRLTVYSSDYPSGLVWDDEVTIEVK